MVFLSSLVFSPRQVVTQFYWLFYCTSLNISKRCVEMSDDTRQRTKYSTTSPNVQLDD